MVAYGAVTISSSAAAAISQLMDWGIIKGRFKATSPPYFVDRIIAPPIGSWCYWGSTCRAVMLPPLQWSLSLSASPKHPDSRIWARSPVTRRGGLSVERGTSAAERRSLSVSGLVKTKSQKILKDTEKYLK